MLRRTSGAAVKRLGIPYPVVQDNAYGDVECLLERVLAAEYLIDRQGNIRKVDFGEGQYSEMEQSIRTLLGNAKGAPTEVPDTQPTGTLTPESYLGFERLARYVGSKLHPNMFSTYSSPANVPQDSLAYDGSGRCRASASSPARTPA